ncbi:MAG: hypothetical protein AAF846_06460, partial [Chloroflexota bacterium]
INVLNLSKIPIFEIQLRMQISCANISLDDIVIEPTTLDDAPKIFIQMNGGGYEWATSVKNFRMKDNKTLVIVINNIKPITTKEFILTTKKISDLNICNINFSIESFSTEPNPIKYQ